MQCLTSEEYEFIVVGDELAHDDPLPENLIARGLLQISNEDDSLVYYTPTNMGLILADIYKKGLHVISV